MAEEPKKSRGGSKLSRSEITTIRLDPKLRYLAELAARKQRRTLSSFIEWAVESTLNRLPISEWDGGEYTFREKAEQLWDVDEADRFAKLAFGFPELMTHDEQVIWKLVKENGGLWRGVFRERDGVWTWSISEQALDLARLREHFDVFKDVATGKRPASALPDWIKEDPDSVPF